MRSDRGTARAASAARVSGDPCPYDLCDGSGFVIDEQTNTALDCRCRPLRIARVRAARLEARIPRRYQPSTFEQVEGDRLSGYSEQTRIVRRFVANLESNLDAGKGLWIIGDVGTGKTALAMLVSKAAIDAGKTVAIYSLPRLLDLMRDLVKDSIEYPGGVTGFLDALCTVDLLHIDDVGAENTTDWVIEQLYSIVNSRYEEQRSIVLTTNLQPDELKEQIGARTVSRIVEMCGDPLPLYGEDRRSVYRAIPPEADAQPFVEPRTTPAAPRFEASGADPRDIEGSPAPASSLFER